MNTSSKIAASVALAFISTSALAAAVSGSEKIWLAAGGGGGGAGWIQFLFLGGFIAIFYFLLIRPQSKRRKEHQALVSGLAKGDEVVSSGGITGTITGVNDDFVKLRIAPNVEIRMQKSSVAATLPKGTLKSIDDA